MCPTIVAHRRSMQPKSLVLGGMVGDPGIEPGMGLPGGVTVRCRTLQHVARREAVDNRGGWGRQPEICVALGLGKGAWRA
jgi:hypothetical protein